MAYDILNTFKNWADRTFGSCFHAAKALDVDHSGILVFNEFRKALTKYGLMLRGKMQYLFDALCERDHEMNQFIPVEGLKFLDDWDNTQSLDNNKDKEDSPAEAKAGKDGRARKRGDAKKAAPEIGPVRTKGRAKHKITAMADDAHSAFVLAMIPNSQKAKANDPNMETTILREKQFVEARSIYDPAEQAPDMYLTRVEAEESAYRKTFALPPMPPLAERDAGNARAGKKEQVLRAAAKMNREAELGRARPSSSQCLLSRPIRASRDVNAQVPWRNAKTVAKREVRGCAQANLLW